MITKDETMTKAPNAPVFLALAVVCLLITVLFSSWLISLPNWMGSIPLFASIPFAGISIFRRERGWVFSIVLLVIAIAIILQSMMFSSSTTTLPVRR